MQALGLVQPESVATGLSCLTIRDELGQAEAVQFRERCIVQPFPSHSPQGDITMNYPRTASALVTARDRLQALQRKPVRISITISHALHESLLQCSDDQGRSLSNLAAYLLETASTELLGARNA
jgi:hypothetical protein